MTPLLKFISGLVGGIGCLGFVLIAHHVELPLSELLKEGLVIGGVASLGVTIWGAKQMPVKEEPKP